MKNSKILAAVSALAATASVEVRNLLLGQEGHFISLNGLEVKYVENQGFSPRILVRVFENAFLDEVDTSYPKVSYHDVDEDGNPVGNADRCPVYDLETDDLTALCSFLWPGQPAGGYYRVLVRHVQRYENVFLVKASSPQEAERLFRENWDKAGYSYDKTTGCPDDTETNIRCIGPSAEGDRNRYYTLKD